MRPSPSANASPFMTTSRTSTSGMALSPSASTGTSMNIGMSVGMNVEMVWKPQQVCADLQKACRVLSERCLKLSAKWAAEQWMGLPADVVSESDISRSQIPDHFLSADNSPAVFYAKTLVELGEYAHAAATLSEVPVSKHSSVESMSPPLPDLSPFGFYLRAYALFMAGERRREESYLESNSNAAKQKKPSSNPYLQQLLHELLDAFEGGHQLDAFGLHVFGMALRAARKTALIPVDSPTAVTVLIESILAFPYNWSAWLDLAEAALEDRAVEILIEEKLQGELSDHFMYHFFCAHLQAEHQAHPEALQIYERWMDPALFGGSPYLLTQYAVVQYHLRQFSAAKRLLEDLHHHMPYRLDSMDVFSNILYVQEDSLSLSLLAHTAVQVDKYRAETCCIVGNYYSLKQQRAKAIQYFQRALKMDRTFTSAWTLMGHEYVEWKQTANAMEAYRQAVEVAPNDYRAWYGLGQTYEFLNMYLFALHYYKQATNLRPFDARMWCALGTTYVHMQRPWDAIRAYERALQQDDTEGVATQKLATLYHKEGRTEKAAQCYLRHLEMRYHATQPGPVSEKAPTLDVMLQDMYVDGPEAEAILFLADYHRSNGEYDTASLFCSRLLEYPGPEKEHAKAMLRELRVRKASSNRAHTRSMGPVGDDQFVFSP